MKNTVQMSFSMNLILQTNHIYMYIVNVVELNRFFFYLVLNNIFDILNDSNIYKPDQRNNFCLLLTQNPCICWTEYDVVKIISHFRYFLTNPRISMIFIFRLQSVSGKFEILFHYATYKSFCLVFP